jgi:mitochondrial fission protein ELM1
MHMMPLSIIAYFDGRLGHEKQTLGILRALADITSTEVVQKRVSISAVSFCRNWASYLLSSLRQPETNGFSRPVDLIIGTGSHTHIPMLLEKKSVNRQSAGSPYVVTCMTPDSQLMNKFDLCCVPMHDEPAERDNVFVTLGPPGPVVCEKRHDFNRGLILIGGLDKKSHKWNSRSVTAQIQAIIKKHPSMQWAISSSPRTPEDTCRMLEEVAASTQQLNFYRSKDTPAGWVEEQYAQHGTVWVTADSISMVYEALSAGCSVGILPVKWLQRDNKFQKSLNILHDRKMIVDFNEWKTGAKMPTLINVQLHESLRCAREILRRWWPDRLQ